MEVLQTNSEAPAEYLSGIGAARGGEHRERPPPPEIEKNCCRKMMLFPKALFLATTFQKVAKNSIFLLNFYQKFSKFPNNVFLSKR